VLGNRFILSYEQVLYCVRLQFEINFFTAALRYKVFLNNIFFRFINHRKFSAFPITKVILFFSVIIVVYCEDRMKGTNTL
jgi:hypothetical protein